MRHVSPCGAVSRPSRRDDFTEDHYNADGNLISWTSSTSTPSGYKTTIMNWADGTQYVVDEIPERVRTGGLTSATVGTAYCHRTARFW